jgi:hypothetical protein
MQASRLTFCSTTIIYDSIFSIGTPHAVFMVGSGSLSVTRRSKSSWVAKHRSCLQQTSQHADSILMTSRTL